MEHLINELIREGYLRTPKIIEAFRVIDRADFLPEELRYEAQINAPLPIGFGQTISQPLTVAFMLELLEPEEGQKILDVGSGSGWTTALLAYIISQQLTTDSKQLTAGGKVIAIEIIPELKKIGERNVSKYNFVEKGIVQFICTDGSKGWPSEAPFDRIIAAASAEIIPPAWREQLKMGGKLVLPVKSSIWLIEKVATDKFKETEFPGFAFVPLVTEK